MAALRCSSSIETVTQIIEVRLESDCLQTSNVDFTSLHRPRNGSLKPMLICAGIFAFVINKFAKAASVHLPGFDLGGGGFKITSLALCCENAPFLGSTLAPAFVRPVEHCNHLVSREELYYHPKLPQ